jgi:hypothetical protein
MSEIALGRSESHENKSGTLILGACNRLDAVFGRRPSPSAMARKDFSRIARMLV